MATKVFRHCTVISGGKRIAGLVLNNLAVEGDEVEVKNSKGRYESGWVVKTVGEEVWADILEIRKPKVPLKLMPEVIVDVGVMQATVRAGDDGDFGTEDDEKEIRLKKEYKRKPKKPKIKKSTTSRGKK